MGKAKIKARPSMPDWFWWGQDACWFCNHKNNCGSCKANRDSAKHTEKLAKHKDLRNRDRAKEQMSRKNRDE